MNSCTRNLVKGKTHNLVGSIGLLQPLDDVLRAIWAVVVYDNDLVGYVAAILDPLFAMHMTL